MSITVKFKFNCYDFVKIRAYGLDYEGRIQGCNWSNGVKSYEVEYVKDGSIESRSFYEDELSK